MPPRPGRRPPSPAPGPGGPAASSGRRRTAPCGPWGGSPAVPGAGRRSGRTSAGWWRAGPGPAWCPGRPAASPRTRGVGRRVPAPYEGGDVVPAHRGEGQFPEALRGQPVGAHGGGAGGEQPAVAREGADEGEEPVTGAVPVGGGISSRPSTRTRPRPALSTRSAQPSGGVSGQPTAVRKAAGAGSAPARTKVRSGRTYGTRSPSRAAVTASHCTRVVLPEPASPRSSTRSSPRSASSAERWTVRSGSGGSPGRAARSSVPVASRLR